MSAPEVIPGRLPPLLDPDAVRAVVTLGLAAVAWGYAWTTPLAALHPFSPWILAAHLLLGTLTVRAGLVAPEVARRLGLALHARGQALTLEADALRWTHRGGETVVHRSEVVDVRERGDWRSRSAGRRFAEVFVVLAPGPDGEPRWLALPPVFERTPGTLAERLMRWRGPLEGPEEGPEGTAHPAPARLASQVYDAAAAGRAPEGGVVLRHGWGWLRRGPYATVLLGLVLAERAMQAPGHLRALLEPAVLAAVAGCLAAVPLMWAALSRRHVAPRKGLAMVLTPAETLIRIRSGILRASWPNLARVHVEAKPAWSLLEGRHMARQLVLERREAPPIRYDEAFVGVPAEVAQGLCEAYRRGILPRPAS
jgi:hypothetical protein